MIEVIYYPVSDLWEMNAVIDRPANALQEMNKVIDRHATDLREMTAVIDYHANDLREMNIVIDYHAIDLRETTTVIDLHANALRETTTVIDRHASDLREMTAAIGLHAIDLRWMNAVIYLHANDLWEITDEEIPTQVVSERRREKESSRRRIFDVILEAGALRIRWACPLLRAIGLDKFGHRADGAEYLFALCGVFELDAIVLLQEHDQLQGVDGVEAEAAAKELVVGGDVLRLDAFEVQDVDDFVL